VVAAMAQLILVEVVAVMVLHPVLVVVQVVLELSFFQFQQQTTQVL
jgi:hypothetical protein